MDEMTDRIALVTGAAGGIGAAVVEALAKAGARIAAVDLDEVGLKAMADRVNAGEMPGRVTPLPCDITDADQVQALVDRVERGLGPVDYLVNGAGVLRPGEIRTLSDQAWAETFAVNATGVFLVSRAIANRMVPRGRGAIVTIGSNAAGTPRTNMTAYAASKAAAGMFTKCLGLELARYGIRCNVVAPGSTDTAMLRSLWHDDRDREATLRGSADAFRVGIPLGRIAEPRDVADAVLFLLSDRAGHVTMHALTVDGGAALGV